MKFLSLLILVLFCKINSHKSNWCIAFTFGIISQSKFICFWPLQSGIPIIESISPNARWILIIRISTFAIQRIKSGSAYAPVSAASGKYALCSQYFFFIRTIVFAEGMAQLLQLCQVMAILWMFKLLLLFENDQFSFIKPFFAKHYFEQGVTASMQIP